MQDRGFDNPRPEPASFTYLRRAASRVALFQKNPPMVGRFEGVLHHSDSIAEVGPKLVNAFGAVNARALARRVREMAEQDINGNGKDNKVAQAALKWAQRADRRITNSGWVDPEPHRRLVGTLVI